MLVSCNNVLNGDIHVKLVILYNSLSNIFKCIPTFKNIEFVVLFPAVCLSSSAPLCYRMIEWSSSVSTYLMRDQPSLVGYLFLILI